MDAERFMAKEWTKQQIVVTTVLVTAAVVGAAIAGGIAILGEGDENERPPIIVNNGSIVFEPVKNVFGQGGGTWAEAGSNKAFTHRHDKGKPRFLQVKATPNDDVCYLKGDPKAVKSPFTGQTIAVTYGENAASSQTADVLIIPDSLNAWLKLDFGEVPPRYDGNDQTLTAYIDNNAVRVLSLTVDDGDVVCTFTRDTRLKIYQLR